MIRSLLEPITEELGLDIIRVSLGSGGKSQLLRVIVDRAGGVDSDILARVSRGLSLQLDAEDLIPGAYRLEVTSPGLDYAFENSADFKRYSGEWVKVSFIDGSTLEGRNLGPLESGDAFTLQLEGKRPGDSRDEVISLIEVARVVRAINWKEVSRKK
ncbi:ribosome maturation factor RimP [Mariprofundus ferrinatatus]|uniref:ribosome maturation factor RimP n=1 Tax=Mariprofundus ferrinatatus TaxID=1921087 RepID=UPI001E5A0B6E|nr:ribosome assembly cofactor RimP [Mariprofundus ferrinatatus]